jgi:hypothetical protein
MHDEQFLHHNRIVILIKEYIFTISGDWKAYSLYPTFGISYYINNKLINHESHTNFSDHKKSSDNG